MNVLIEARSLAAKSGGIKTYTHELIKNLLLRHSEENIEVVYGSQKAVGTFPSTHESVVPLHSELLLSYWLSSKMVRHIQQVKPSVVHYTKAAMPSRKVAPTVVTLYDIIPILLPETQSFLRRMYWPAVLEHAATHADHIMTISQQSKRDIMKYYNTPEEKITVTPLAVDTGHFSPRGEKSSKPYILFVGTRDARKNVPTLIRAFSAIAHTIPHRLVIAGRTADKEDASKQVAAMSGVADRIEFREYVPYEELPALYSGADLFVWPSVYEGWGFPPQEAMACGTPVIVSNGGSLSEVVGDAGIVIPFYEEDLHARMEDTEFTQALSEQMLEVLQNTSVQQRLREQGLIQAKKFSWQDLAASTWDVYTKLAS